jgi:hypothetical protein
MAALVAKIGRRGSTERGDGHRFVRLAAPGDMRQTPAAMLSARTLFPLAGLLLALSACGRAEQAPAQAEPAATPPAATPPAEPQGATAAGLKPLAQKKFGQPVTEAKTTALTDLTKEPAKFADQTVRTEGTVSAVCKSMGCWMEIADASGQAHIKMAGHSFYVPRDANGHRAVIQGKVMPAGGGEGVCGAKDGCGQEDSAKMAKVEIEATGIEFLD